MADADVLDQVTKNVPWLIIPATILTATPKLLEIWQGVAGTRDKRKALEIVWLQLGRRCFWCSGLSPEALPPGLILSPRRMNVPAMHWAQRLED